MASGKETTAASSSMGEGTSSSQKASEGLASVEDRDEQMVVGEDNNSPPPPPIENEPDANEGVEGDVPPPHEPEAVQEGGDVVAAGEIAPAGQAAGDFACEIYGARSSCGRKGGGRREGGALEEMLREMARGWCSGGAVAGERVTASPWRRSSRLPGERVAASPWRRSNRRPHHGGGAVTGDGKRVVLWRSSCGRWRRKKWRMSSCGRWREGGALEEQLREMARGWCSGGAVAGDGGGRKGGWCSGGAVAGDGGGGGAVVGDGERVVL
nr:hypothetical protein Iba_chr09dCG10500 [Ipomoea batatas]